MKENRKKTIRISILILILLIGIGYAALKTTLKVDGTVNIDKATWDVHFENVNTTSGSVTASPAPTTNNIDTTEMTYTINFTKPGDFYEFTVDIVNNGTIDAMIETISNNVYANAQSTTPITLPSYLKSTITYDNGIQMKENQLLPKKNGNTKTKETIRVRIEFKKDISVSDLPSDGDTSVVFKFNGKFKQADANAKEKYDVGEEVYFNPVSTDSCNSSTFSVNDIVNGTSTCYKWNIISYDDDYVTIQLDHNVAWSDPVLFNPSETTDSTLQALANATSTWTRVDPITYSYDASSMSNSYGTLTCTNGTCKVTGNDTPKITGLRARIITGEEIRQLTLDDGASNTSAAYNWSISSGTDYSAFWFSNKKYTIGSKGYTATNDGKIDLKWLVQNLQNDTDSEATEDVYGITYSTNYWTLSPYYAMSQYYAWRVRSQGDIYVDGTHSGGLRPVVRIPKSLLG